MNKLQHIVKLYKVFKSKVIKVELFHKAINIVFIISGVSQKSNVRA